VILDQNAVEEDGGVGGGFDGAVVVEGGRGPDHVVALPLAGFAGWVGEWDGLLVDAAGLAVDVGLVVVVVEDLKLVACVAGAGRCEEDAAVAACLIGARNVFGDAPLNVKLIVFEAALGFDVAGAWSFAYSEDVVGDSPLCWGFVFGGDPLVEVFSVEEDDRVGGRRGVGGARCDDRWNWFVDFGVLMFRRCWLLRVEGDGENDQGCGGKERRMDAHDFLDEDIPYREFLGRFAFSCGEEIEGIERYLKLHRWIMTTKYRDPSPSTSLRVRMTTSKE
jgi:hypothetical protein